MSQETKKQVEDLISESYSLMEALRGFFYSVPIQYDPFLRAEGFTIADLPDMWDYDSEARIDPFGEPVLHYRWFKLTHEQFLEQEELFRRHINWASSARSLIEEFLPDKLAVFDEESLVIRKWIELSERVPSDDNAKLFLRFKKHLINQQDILSALLKRVEE